jgi:hypothetical protein
MKFLTFMLIIYSANCYSWDSDDTVKALGVTKGLLDVWQEESEREKQESEAEQLQYELEHQRKEAEYRALKQKIEQNKVNANNNYLRSLKLLENRIKETELITKVMLNGNNVDNCLFLNNFDIVSDGDITLKPKNNSGYTGCESGWIKVGTYGIYSLRVFKKGEKVASFKYALSESSDSSDLSKDDACFFAKKKLDLTMSHGNCIESTKKTTAPPSLIIGKLSVNDKSNIGISICCSYKIPPKDLYFKFHDGFKIDNATLNQVIYATPNTKFDFRSNNKDILTYTCEEQNQDYDSCEDFINIGKIHNNIESINIVLSCSNSEPNNRLNSNPGEIEFSIQNGTIELQGIGNQYSCK